MKERGKMKAKVILVKIFFHEKMILMDSLKIPVKPRNWSSSWSMSVEEEEAGDDDD